MPSHNHQVQQPTYAGFATGNLAWLATSPGSNLQYGLQGTDSKGGGQPHNNMQPFNAVNFLVQC